jgi:hypothetical protein
MRPANQRIWEVDARLRELCGLRNLPGWTKRVNALLDARRELMTERDRGFRITDRRSVARE